MNIFFLIFSLCILVFCSIKCGTVSEISTRTLEGPVPFSKTSNYFSHDQLIEGNHLPSTIEGTRIREDRAFVGSNAKTNDYYVDSSPIGGRVLSNNTLQIENMNLVHHYQQDSNLHSYRFETKTKTQFEFETVKNERKMQIKKTKTVNSKTEQNRLSPQIRDHFIIDPLKYSSFFAGNGRDQATNFYISRNSKDFGFVIVGTTTSLNFPTEGDLKSVEFLSKGDNSVAFITNLDMSGEVMFSSYFGGLLENTYNQETKVVVPRVVLRAEDSTFWIAGHTNRNDLPLTQHAFQSLVTTGYHGFITQISADCDEILYSTYFGGVNDSSITEISQLYYDYLESNLYIGGQTSSSDPTLFKNEIQDSNSISTGDMSLYLGLFNIGLDETTLLFGTKFGGQSLDSVSELYILKNEDQSASIWVTGSTFSDDFFDHYDHDLSPDVTFISKVKYDNKVSSGYFLKLSMDSDQENVQLESASFLGAKYGEASLSLKPDYLQSSSRSFPIIDSGITICGVTGNYNNYTFQDKLIKPDWMKNDTDESSSQVGFVMRINQTTSELLYGFFFGCQGGNTTIFYLSSNASDTLVMTGISNCKIDELQMTHDVWDYMPTRDETINHFEYKYFILKINGEKLLNHTNYSYDEFIQFSSWVDGSSEINAENLYYQAIKIDNSGNIFSVRNLLSEDYYNDEIILSSNNYQNQGDGSSSLMIRILTGVNCHPGAFNSSQIEAPHLTGVCFPSMAGYYTNTFDNFNCLPCQPGTYQSIDGSTYCLPCPDDTHSLLGQSECVVEDSPNPPKATISNVLPNGFTIDWVPYRHAPGSEFYFEIQFYSPNSLKSLFFVNNTALADVGSFDARGLTPSTRYYVKMRGYYRDNNLNSCWSREVTILTDPKPGIIDANNIQESPGYNFYELSWDEPYHQSNITEYLISYYQEDDSDTIFNRVSLTNKIVIYDLQVSTKYYVTICARNSAGYGPSIEYISIKTQPDSPNDFSVSILDTSSKSVTLQWSTPNCRGSEITHYQYTITSPIQKTAKFGTSKSTNYVIPDLQSSTSYQIVIDACNAIGCTNNESDTYVTSINELIIFVPVISFLLIILLILIVALRSQFYRKKRKSDIKKLILKKKKEFENKIIPNLSPSGDTLICNTINERAIHQLVLDIDNGKYIQLGKDNYIVFHDKAKNELVFCKETNLFEANIYRFLWRQFLLKPQQIPLIQFIGFSETSYQDTHKSKKGTIKNKQLHRNSNTNSNSSIRSGSGSGSGSGSSSDSNTNSDSFSMINSEILKENQKLKDLNIQEKNKVIFSINNDEKNDDDDGNDDELNDILNDDLNDDDLHLIEKNKLSEEKYFFSKPRKIEDERRQIRIIALEFLPYSLEDFILKRKELNLPLTIKEKVFFTYNLFISIKFLHNNWIIHRDLKPKNILIGFDGFLRIVDFDSSIKLSEGQNIYRDGFVGTHEYFDPFCQYSFDDSKGIANYVYTFAHDIYSIGKILEKIDKLEIDSQGKDKKNKKKKKHIKKKEKVKSENVGLIYNEMNSENSENESLTNPLPLLIKQCYLDHKSRPSIHELINNLKEIHEI
ncbi:palmitoyltransferase [Anaeramoeba flamelloides]|uniref:Palmitoyltransferase n=1 Tax=Anaeramoeba flamelloides TaxID=1746091 RepID=A0ABQ8X5K2_9EUKA|nr:palmitoyltransferase [Anaeramoeba flamelloides]